MNPPLRLLPAFSPPCSPPCSPPPAAGDDAPLRLGPLVGASPQTRALFARIRRAAACDATVLVTGETGTGKELVARAVHDASPRSERPFVVVDCAALAEGVFEAELYGHARGAFTGAIEARVGAIESAAGGTVFLDEIGELPLHLQPKLLRVLESHTVRRVGESTYRSVDVRFVSATHRDLPAMVREGRFREDLLYRLSVIPLAIEPLRERPADVVAIARHLVRPEHHRLLTAELLATLAARRWPGNVRQLRNFLERAQVLGAPEALRLDDAESEPGPAASPEDGLDALMHLPLPEFRAAVLARAERAFLERLLAAHGGKVSAAAAAAGVHRGHVYRLVRRHGL